MKTGMRTIVFRTDASMQIGTGHVMRCLTLADELSKQGADCQFICREHPGNLIESIRKRGFSVHALPAYVGTFSDRAVEPAAVYAPWLGGSWEMDARQSREIIRTLEPNWLVVDHYALDARWEAAVTPEECHLLVIDDLANRPHEGDLLLDQNLGRHSGDYAGLVPETCRLLIGPRYALLRPEFARLREESLRRRQSPHLKRLLINMGGVDKDNATAKVLDALRACSMPACIEIDLVMGSTAAWLEAVRAQAAAMPWPTRLLVDVTDMAQRMAEADLAIGAAGSTSWERCCLGVPTLILTVAENQQSIAEALASAGTCVYLDSTQRLEELPLCWEEYTNPEALRAMSEASTSVTDGLGTRRVCQNMPLET